jgi:hypothetical protein
MLPSEIAKCFDLELKSGALQKHFVRNITPNVKLIQEARARGENPVGVTLIENVRDGKPGKRQASFNPPQHTASFPSVRWFVNVGSV